MGVVTTADRKRDEAKEHLQSAYDCIMAATDEDNQWAEKYNESYIETLFNVALKIRKLKAKL